MTLGRHAGFGMQDYLRTVAIVDISVFVHPLAYVDGGTVGARSKVWQFASIIRGSKVGDDCNIGSCCIIDSAMVGNRCCIGHGASINPGAHVGDDCFIGPNAVLCNDMWPRASKEGFDIDQFLSGEFVSIIIEDGASVGAGATVLPGVKVGSGAMIAAGAVVDKDVPALHLFDRNGNMMPLDPSRATKRMRQVHH